MKSRGLMQLDDELCYCFHVSKRKIVNFLRQRRPQRASQLSECGGAGTGCGWCVPYLQRCFENYRAGLVEAAESITPQEYAAGRARHLAARRAKPPEE